jgi:hypothetical protein
VEGSYNAVDALNNAVEAINSIVGGSYKPVAAIRSL